VSALTDEDGVDGPWERAMDATPKRRRGGQPRPGGPRSTVTLRVSAEEAELLERAAEHAGEQRSTWIRSVALAAAREDLA
jgi:hypothetical protein